MNFALAFEALKQGKKLARIGWDVEGLFVFMQVPSEIKREIIPKMQSLPQSVKDEFEKRFNDPNCQIDAIYYDYQLAMVHSSNLITGYSPSVIDIFMEDWTILP